MPCFFVVSCPPYPSRKIIFERGKKPGRSTGLPESEPAACARPAPGPWPSLPLPAPSSGTLASHRDPLAQLAAPHTSGDAQRAAPRAVPRPAPSLLTASRRPKGLGRIERRFVGMSWGCWVEILRGIWSPKQMSDRLRYNFNGMANGSHGNAKKGMKYKLWCQVRAVFGWG